MAMIVLRPRMKIYETQGCSRESAVLAAMADFDWPNRAKTGEVKRVLLEMRRIDKAERPQLKPPKPNGPRPKPKLGAPTP